jgi:hypothetical protein
MSDQYLMDDLIGSFDQPQLPSATKGKLNDSQEHQAFNDNDPFGIHTGQENHHDTSNGNGTHVFSASDDLFTLDNNQQQQRM